jgi:hypothetical protein
MVYFHPKSNNLGKFWKALQWKMLVFFIAILSTLQPTGICYCHLVPFLVIWYTFSSFGMLYREKSGNPARDRLLGRCPYQILHRLISAVDGQSPREGVWRRWKQVFKISFGRMI